MQVEDEFASGEMLCLTEYNCEGIEEPWGFPLEIVEGLPQHEVVSGSTFRSKTRRGKIKLARGDIAIALNRVSLRHPSIDAFYVVLVRGMKVCVYPRFLSRAIV